MRRGEALGDWLKTVDGSLRRGDDSMKRKHTAIVTGFRLVVLPFNTPVSSIAALLRVSMLYKYKIKDAEAVFNLNLCHGSIVLVEAITHNPR